ncbi:MAG: WcaF family extracellular polysaccharide biosynthesis acetyltransferase [Acidobacteriaceae bacterium]|nr:WcaF family extracellular polysaccharide biosynthesis acetyltransferase [Acidobacteriaceae bacterium]
MSPVRLRSFRNSWYRPGRSIFWQLGWFFLGLPLLRSSLIPSSAFRVRILRLFGATIGDGVVIKPGVRVKYPWRLAVGDACWLGEDCWIDNLADVCIGNNVCVSQGTYFCTGNHDWTDSSFGLIVKPITLQDGSWAGAKAILAPGVTLGECAIASAGSVVTKNIPPYEIHGGNPAVFLKQRHVESQRLNFEFSIEEQVAS